MIHPGQVWLVGAGPGDPDLLTRKAEKLLRAASVIFYDALVGPAILALANPAARLVPVGKRANRHSRAQGDINALLVAAAQAGERVVRLKGGDPAIFGRAAEEMDALRRAGFAAHICPGITAASAAAASLGASLTLRGTSRRLTLVTAHLRGDSNDEDIDWSSLADPQATIAIYMGKAAAPTVAARLMMAGLAADTPVALVENASLPDESCIRTRLDLLPLVARTTLSDGPALILIGAAMAKHHAIIATLDQDGAYLRAG